MSLRTRQGLTVWAALLFVAAACSAAPAPATPGAATPGAATPGAATPAAETPGAATPAAETPGAESPGAESPGTESPAAESPAAESPAAESPAAESPAATDGGPVQPGGTIVIGDWQEPTTVNPYLSNAWVTSQAAMPVLPPLVLVDASGEWVPYLLQELPTATEEGDGFTLTMRVKPNLTWSDGEPLDANDIAYTYQWAVEMAEAGIGCGLCGALALRLPDDSDYYITDVTVSEDGSEVVFNWSQKYAGWLAWSAVSVLPEQHFGDIPPDQVSGSMPLSDALADIPGYGPFVFTGAGAGRIDYARNDAFTAFEGPNLDGLRRVYFGSKDGMITAFLTGEIDQMANMTQVDYDAISNVSPDIGRAEIISAWQYEHLDINSGAGLDEDRNYPPGFVRPQEMGLDDPAIRNAIAQAIDKEDLWNTLFPGHPFEYACTNAPPSSWWADPSIECDPYDPEAAGAALDAAGWTIGESGFREDADGNVMRLLMCTTAGNPTRLTTLGKVNQYLGAIGIPSEIRTADAGSVIFADYPDVTDETECALSRGNYHISLFTYLLSDPGALYYSLFHSANLPPNGDNGNWTRIANDELDATLETALEAIAQEDIEASLGGVLQAVVDLKPEVPLYYRAEPVGVSRHLGGFQQNPSLFGPVWNVHEWHFIP